MNGTDTQAAPALPDFRLDGRLALVTGASSGLGRHFALTLARAGARVAVAARRAERLAATVAEIEAAGGEALALPLDVADAASVRACFDALEAGPGTPGRKDRIRNSISPAP